ncbi:MAG: metal-dependent hydrolase [Leptolyngbyaceae cyanobacterium MO_188.B28]|nr:metal-dependent hydrolase [Leptolyngbyaceae cyanobacterium MO_188.B28]
MSSFVGHSLIALTIGTASNHSKTVSLRRYRLLWLSWLTIVALAPDLDYILSFLHPSSHQGLRITHSLFACQLLPILTLIFLRYTCKPDFWTSGRQVVLAGLSHIGLDLLVGVTALPLLWPLSNQVFKLPFGLLPSAGKLSLLNYYLYSNLAIELGALAPLCFCGYFLTSPQKITWKGWLTVSLLLLTSVRCLYWAYHLSR